MVMASLFGSEDHGANSHLLIEVSCHLCGK
jgi:hypothetical protein